MYLSGSFELRTPRILETVLLSPSWVLVLKFATDQSTLLFTSLSKSP
ncbi:hypothetical protein ES319_A05G250200v1 [Gossypium barbadense]|uniref:Uncharacterized protein n=1 Tax=Gossypium barbadense TaxID=3634 RepID=A0A5J5VTS9_GOSBA|nr:hypothetical protein ES319_A05G250200v1 [Gossypium barbadense]